MTSSRKNDFEESIDLSTSNFSVLFYKMISLIHYPIQHPFKTIAYLLCLDALAKKMQFLFSPKESDDLHMAYSGPSFLYVQDKTFNQTRDLIGWTTDRHPTGIFENGWKHVSSSFNLDEIKSHEKEKLLQRRYAFYEWAYLESNFEGYCNILSHRSHTGDQQSTFGFYGSPSIDAFKSNHYQKQGFIVGIRAFGNEDYHHSVNGKTYQLAKIDLNTIDFAKINFEYNGSPYKIVHAYLRHDKVQQHPDTEGLDSISLEDGWNSIRHENYIKILPNFSDTVDWVIQSSELPAVFQGKSVMNLIDNKEINILDWQSKQQRKGQQPLEKYSIFALPRPSDYDFSYERDEISGELNEKPPLLFKIGKK